MHTALKLVEYGVKNSKKSEIFVTSFVTLKYRNHSHIGTRP